MYGMMLHTNPTCLYSFSIVRFVNQEDEEGNIWYLKDNILFMWLIV